MRKLRYCVAHTLTGRYATQVNLGVQSFGFLRPFVWYCRQMSFFTLKFVVYFYSSRKTGKVLCLPQWVLVLFCCQFSVRKVWKGQVYRAFCTCWSFRSLSFPDIKAWLVAERWTLFWWLIYHSSCLGWFLNHSTIAIVAFGRVNSVYLIEFA